MTFSYIGLGANLGDAVVTLLTVIEELDASPGVSVSKVSSFYRSRPMADMDQPDYVNAVLALETNLLPEDLLDLLQTLENAHGREREERWGARTLDLDILLYGEMQMVSERLTIPHQGLAEREFVVFPLLEIAAELCIPGQGLLAEIAQSLDLRGMERIEKKDYA